MSRILILGLLPLVLAASSGFASVVKPSLFPSVGILPVIDRGGASVAVYDTTPSITLSVLLVFIPITDGLGDRIGTGFAFCSTLGPIDPVALPVCAAAPIPYDVNIPKLPGESSRSPRAHRPDRDLHSHLRPTRFHVIGPLPTHDVRTRQRHLGGGTRTCAGIAGGVAIGWNSVPG